MMHKSPILGTWLSGVPSAEGLSRSGSAPLVFSLPSSKIKEFLLTHHKLPWWWMPGAVSKRKREILRPHPPRAKVLTRGCKAGSAWGLSTDCITVHASLFLILGAYLVDLKELSISTWPLNGHFDNIWWWRHCSQWALLCEDAHGHGCLGRKNQKEGKSQSLPSCLLLEN